MNKIQKVYSGGSHEVFHITLTLAGEQHQHHLKYRYDTREWFGQESCWHTATNPCPAIETSGRRANIKINVG